MTDTNKPATTTIDRLRLARAPGILFLTAALLVPLSGVVAFDAGAPLGDALTGNDTAAADIAPPVDRGNANADANAESDTSGDATDLIPRPDVQTGERLDEERKEAFAAWIAQEQAAGRHRGFAFY